MHTFRLVPSVFVCVYNNLIRVLLHIGHVPRPLDGRLHRTRPLFVLANDCEPLFNRVCVFLFTISIEALGRHRMSHQELFLSSVQLNKKCPFFLSKKGHLFSRFCACLRRGMEKRLKQPWESLFQILGPQCNKMLCTLYPDSNHTRLP